MPVGAGRFARNAVVQGAAAELFKAWAATVRDGLVALDGAIVLCLHDELLLQVPEPAADAAAALLSDALAATAAWWAAGSPVRFVAEVQVGAQLGRGEGLSGGRAQPPASACSASPSTRKVVHSSCGTAPSER